MTTAEIITEMLGPNWWEREHDGTAILAVLDRLMEFQYVERDEASESLMTTTFCRIDWTTGEYSQNYARLARLRNSVEVALGTEHRVSEVAP